MPRNRMISPMIWEDPNFNNLSRNARLLFISLISYADDEGYFRADSKSLRRWAFGFDELNQQEIITWLKEIQSKIPTIHFYENNKEAYGHFIKWDKYQKQKKDRIVPSSYHKCTFVGHLPDNVGQVPDNVGQVPDKSSTSKVKLSKVKLSKVKRRKGNIENANTQIELLDKKEFKETLQKLFPTIAIEEEIAKMKDWLASSGKEKKDYAAFARNWLRATKSNNKNEGMVIVR